MSSQASSQAPADRSDEVRTLYDLFTSNFPAVGAGKAFADWTKLTVAALCGDEETYRDLIEQYDDLTNAAPTSADHPGAVFAEATAEFVAATQNPEAPPDVLGEVYMDLSHQSDRLGQHFTPHSLVEMMVKFGALDQQVEKEPAEKSSPPIPHLSGTSIADPACGSGRMLLVAAKHTKDCWVHGVDVDPTCARMAALNCWVNEVDALIVHGDSLKAEAHNAYTVNSDPEGTATNLITALLGTDPNWPKSQLAKVESIEEA